MEIVIQDSPQEDRWPLAFRAAIAMACGAAVLWWSRDFADSLSDEPLVTDVHEWGADKVLYFVGVSLGVGAMLVATCVRRRWFRDAWLLVALFIVGAILALDSVVGVNQLCAAHDGPVEVSGLVASAPRVDDGGSDLLARYFVRAAAQTFTLDVSEIVTNTGVVSVRESVLVRVAGLAPLPPRGVKVRVRGWLRVTHPVTNPGIKNRDQLATLSVSASSLITALPQGFVAGQLVHLRGLANHALQQSMPEWASPESCALVSAMTTGVKVPGLSRPATEFRAAGMSHVLAISGFNVAVLVAAVAGSLKLVGVRARGRAVVAFTVALTFLAITEPETSVLRAGLGAGIAALGSIRGGQARGLGTLGVVALFTMFFDIEAVAGAGFQLSYGVVIALLIITPRVQRRWDEFLTHCCVALLWRPVATSEFFGLARSVVVEMVVAALVAWTISTPLALWHAGSMSGLAAPLSIFTMPAAALTTICGVLAMVVSSCSLLLASYCGSIAAGCAAFLEGVAQTAGNLPGGACVTGRSGIVWTLLCITACITAWISHRLFVRTLGWSLVLLLLVGIFQGWLRPLSGVPNNEEISVESLAIGRGACHLVRCDGVVVLFDAGSAGDANCGSRKIVPALAALGVRHIDFLVIGSRSLASCSAIPEVIAAFPVQTVLADPDCLRSVQEARSGFAAVLRQSLAQRKVPMKEFGDREEIVYGTLVMRAVVPPREPDDRGFGGGLLVAVRHQAWHTTVPPVNICGDARVGGRAKLKCVPFPEETALQTTVRNDGVHIQRSWTRSGWR